MDGTTAPPGLVEAETCPVCKSDRFLNPTMIILVSPCYHKMCNACVNRIFLGGPAPCPFCKTILRKIHFVKQTFENLLVEKEVQVRKRLARIYNQPPDAFPSLTAYNDYLEGVEEVVHCLLHGIRVSETEAALEAYREAHKEEIARNLARQLREEREVVQALEQERRDKLLRKEAYLKQALLEAQAVEEQKATTLRQLAESSTTKSATDIITASRTQTRVTATAQELLQASAAHLTQMDEEHSRSDLSALADLDPAELEMPEHVNYEDAGLYYRVMENYMDPWTLPFKPTTDTPESQAARAGGFTPQCVYERSLRAAFAGIFAA